MKQTYLFIIAGTFIAMLFTTCKKVTQKINSEKPFFLFFADYTTGEIRSECFDRVYAQNNKNINACSDAALGMELPLSIADTSRVFLFEKDSRVDTFKINYSRRYVAGNKEYEVRFKVNNVFINKIKQRFDSVSTKCTTELSIYCNSDEGLFAIIYL